MLFANLLLIMTGASVTLAAPYNHIGQVVPGVIPRDNGDCAFADGKSATIPNGQRGCCALGGVRSDSLNGNLCECKDGLATQVDTCPTKHVFLFITATETCHPAPGQDPGFTCT